MILSQPFPASQDLFRLLRNTFYAGFVVFLILVLFQPFGFNKTPSNLIFRNAFYFAFATFIIASVNALLLPVIFPRFFSEQKWTVSKEIYMMVWQVVSISFANLLLFNWLYEEEISGRLIVQVLGITVAVGVFPITLVILLKQYALLKKYGSGAAILDQKLQLAVDQPSATTLLITVTGDNQHETLSFQLADFRFITVADNYIKVYFMKEEKLRSEVLRSTLKKSGERLSQYAQVFRCHRAYLVNLQAVDKISGNAQGYKLQLKDVNELIPVSRYLNQELTNRLQMLSTNSH